MIEIAGLEKTFDQPGGEKAIALRGVDLSIPAGQFVSVIGSNGSGKSTILNVVAGTYRPDFGSIHIAGTDVTRWPEHKRAKLVGRVFQDPFKGTCPSMTVAENLRMHFWGDDDAAKLARGLRAALEATAMSPSRSGK